MQDRRSVARNTGLIVVAFVATLILLAGLVLVVNGRVLAGHRRGLSRAVGWRIRHAGRFPGVAGPTGFAKCSAGHAVARDAKRRRPGSRRRRRHRRLHDGQRRGHGRAPGRHPRDGDARSATTPIRTEPRPSTRTATTRPGAATSSGRGRSPATTTTTRRARSAISTTSARPPSTPTVTRGIRTTWVSGTSSPSTRSARRRTTACSIPSRAGGSRPISQPRTRCARWRCGMCPGSAPASTRTTTTSMPSGESCTTAGADVIVNGHDHDYERFAPQDPDAVEDRERGIREFVVGTGGTTLRPFEELAANSELRAGRMHGVLKFTLHPDELRVGVHSHDGGLPGLGQRALPLTTRSEGRRTDPRNPIGWRHG